MLIERDGRAFHVDTSHDGDDFWQRYYVNGWEREQAQVLAQVPFDGTLVDIGAWIGAWTLPALARGLDVVAYEPDHIAYERLLANLDANGWPHGISHRVMVGAAAGEGTLIAQSDCWGGSNSGRWANGTATITCPRVALADVLAGVARPFVKMDVEGDELDLFPIVAHHAIPCHVSLHAPLAKLAGVRVDFRRLLPSFARYATLIMDGRQAVTPETIPYRQFCSITCLDPR